MKITFDHLISDFTHLYSTLLFSSHLRPLGIDPSEASAQINRPFPGGGTAAAVPSAGGRTSGGGFFRQLPSATAATSMPVSSKSIGGRGLPSRGSSCWALPPLPEEVKRVLSWLPWAQDWEEQVILHCRIRVWG